MEEKILLVETALKKGLLNHAFRLLRPYVLAAGADYRWSDRLQSLEQNYSYLTQYFLSGQDDPERTAILQQMVAETYRLWDEITFSMRNVPNTRLRMEEVARMAIEAQAAQAQEKQISTTTEEDIQYTYLCRKAIFYRFWLDEPLEEWRALIYENDPEWLSLAVAGIMVSALDTFSEKKIQCVLDDLLILPLKAQARAMVGLVFFIAKYGHRLPYFPSLAQRIEAAMADQHLREMYRMAVHFILESHLTPQVEKLLQDMQQVIFDGLHKAKDSNEPLVIDVDESEENIPEWQRDVHDMMCARIDDIDRLVKAGGDFTYSSSKAMLNDSFFQTDIANFFLSFALDNPILAPYITSEKGQNVSRYINLDHTMCDCDKFCMYLIQKHIGSELMQNISIHTVEDEDSFDKLSEKEQRFFTTKQEAKRMFRFFNHNPWGFQNLMVPADQICTETLLQTVQRQPEGLNPLVDKCIKLGLYAAAEKLLDKEKANDIETLQKRAFVRIKQEKYTEAMGFLQMAIELYDDSWAINQMAKCHKQLLDYDGALAYYNLLLESDANKKTWLMNKAECLMALHREEEALQVFFQLDLLYPNLPKVMRGLGWCAFVCDRKDTANRYLEQMAFADNCEVNDCLNYAHLLFCNHEREEAMRMYRLAKEKAESTMTFMRLFRKDIAVLTTKISKEEVTLLEDSLVTL